MASVYVQARFVVADRYADRLAPLIEKAFDDIAAQIATVEVAGYVHEIKKEDDDEQVPQWPDEAGESAVAGIESGEGREEVGTDADEARIPERAAPRRRAKAQP